VATTKTQTDPRDELEQLHAEFASARRRYNDVLPAQRAELLAGEQRAKQQLLALYDQRARGAEGLDEQIERLRETILTTPARVQQVMDEHRVVEHAMGRGRQKIAAHHERHFEHYAMLAEEAVEAWERARDELLALPAYREALKRWSAAAQAWSLAATANELEGIPGCPFPAELDATPRPTKIRYPGHAVPRGDGVAKLRLTIGGGEVVVYDQHQLEDLLGRRRSDGEPLFEVVWARSDAVGIVERAAA
jgi:hypothetical protein